MSVARVAASWFFACPMPPSGRPELRPVVCVGQGFAALGLNVHILRLLRAQCFRATSPLSAGAGRCCGDAGPDLALAAKWCFVRIPDALELDHAARCHRWPVWGSCAAEMTTPTNGRQGPHRRSEAAAETKTRLGNQGSAGAGSEPTRSCTFQSCHRQQVARL